MFVYFADYSRLHHSYGHALVSEIDNQPSWVPDPYFQYHNPYYVKHSLNEGLKIFFIFSKIKYDALVTWKGLVETQKVNLLQKLSTDLS